MANEKTLIQSACVLTMDDQLGMIREGDVLIEDDRIAPSATDCLPQARTRSTAPTAS
jgi:hypothetical protein